MRKVVKIERLVPPSGAPEMPFHIQHGYKMADPAVGGDRHHARHAIYKPILEEVAHGLEQGLSLWMKQSGKRETLISAVILRVTYV